MEHTEAATAQELTARTPRVAQSKIPGKIEKPIKAKKQQLGRLNETIQARKNELILFRMKIDSRKGELATLERELAAQEQELIRHYLYHYFEPSGQGESVLDELRKQRDRMKVGDEVGWGYICMYVTHYVY